MNHKANLLSWSGLAVASVAFAFILSFPASAADVSKEVAAAAQHAGYAAGAKELKMVQAHLQHTVNCLVGPKGKGFDGKQLNPCKDLGNGIIPDTADAAKKKDYEAALGKAEAGLEATDLAAAQKNASEAEAMLKKASM